jgi:hypothetical protein
MSFFQKISITREACQFKKSCENQSQNLILNDYYGNFYISKFGPCIPLNELLKKIFLILREVWLGNVSEILNDYQGDNHYHFSMYGEYPFKRASERDFPLLQEKSGSETLSEPGPEFNFK